MVLFRMPFFGSVTKGVYQHQKSLGKVLTVDFLCFSILLFASFFILARVDFFFDFATYEAYIAQGTYYQRFDSEPFSVFFMFLAQKSGAGAKGYYYLCWWFVFFLVVTTCYYKFYGFWFFLSLLLLFNPLMLLTFQTPRQFIAAGLFFASICYGGKSRIFFLASIPLFHTISGLFAIGLFVAYQFNRFLIPLLFFVLYGVFLWFLIDQYDFYLHEHDRGRGRLLYLLAFFSVFFLLIPKKMNKEFIFLGSLFSFLIIAYLTSPYANRLFVCFLVPACLYLFVTCRGLDSRLVMKLFSSLTFFFAIFFVGAGMYGYG